MKTIKKESENKAIAKNLIQEIPDNFLYDSDILAELIDTDIRDNLPPQMLQVIAAVMELIAKFENNKSLEK